MVFAATKAPGVMATTRRAAALMSGTVCPIQPKLGVLVFFLFYLGFFFPEFSMKN